MSKQIRVLDCTLRDGGFVNDFNFGRKVIRNIFTRLSNAQMDIIEIGYLYDKKKYDANFTRYWHTESINELLVDKKSDAMVVAITDFGNCALEHIQDAKETILDGIRLTFKKSEIDAAMEYAQKLKEKGYVVFAQPVSVTTYSDREMLDLIDKINELAPYAVSIVDTYGLMHQGKVLHYFHLLDNNLNPDIVIGFHSHNNFQMAYANCIELIKEPTRRDLILDASCYGMGKSAGNTCTELLCMYLNVSENKEYKISEILEVIDSHIIPIYNETPWGYCYEHYIAARSKVHHNYVTYLEKKQTLSAQSELDILNDIPAKDKLNYNEQLIENLYLKYQDKQINDETSYTRLTDEISGRKVILLGPGASIKNQLTKVNDFISCEKPFVISINNALSGYPIDLAFIANSKRYDQLFDTLSKKKLPVAATSNIAPLDKEFDYMFNYAKLIDLTSSVKDISLLMCLKVLQGCGIKEVYLAGFDGFSSVDPNFYTSFMKFSHVELEADELNEIIGVRLTEYSKCMRLHFLTSSLYENYINQ